MSKSEPAPASYATLRPAPSERRSCRRIRLHLDTAVPVLVRSDVGVQWGLARNVSEGGMLIEIKTPAPIGTPVEIKLFGVQGSIDAPDAVVMHAEVRHHVAWNFRGGPGRPSLTAIGVRFVEPREDVAALLVGGPVM